MSDTRIDNMPYSELDGDGDVSPPTQLTEVETAMGTKANPNHTPPRSIRVVDDLWIAVGRTATERGESISEATNRFYARYVKDHARKQAQETGTPLEEILRRLGA